MQQEDYHKTIAYPESWLKFFPLTLLQCWNTTASTKYDENAVTKNIKKQQHTSIVPIAYKTNTRHNI